MKFFCSILLALLLCGHPLAPLYAAETLLLDDARYYPLAGKLEHLSDPSGTLTLPDLLAPGNHHRFTAIPGNVNHGYTSDTVWVRFTMQRTLAFPDHGYLRLGPRYLDYITVYLQTGANPADPAAYRVIQMGDHIPIEKNSVKSTDYLLPLTLPVEQACRVYIKVRSSSSLILTGSVHSPESVINYNNLSILLNGGYLAICLVIVLINLIFFLRLHDRLYLYFALYILLLFLNHTGLTGMLPILLPQFVHLISDYLVGCGMGVSVSVFSLFAIRLFSVPHGTWAHRYLIGMLALGCLTAVAVPLGYYAPLAQILMIGLLGLIILMTWLSFKAFRRGEPEGILYMTAFGISNIGYGVQFLRLLGLVPGFWWNMHAIQISTLLNMILMTLALTERVHAAEQKAIKAARDSEHKAVELAAEMTLELREKQQALEDALERQTRFVDMVSHEYRTPLAIIKANLDLLRDGRAHTVQSTSMALMQRAVARLVEVMESSLGVSRLAESAKLSQNHERIEAADFLSEIRDEARGLWGGAALELPPHSTALVFVLADRSQLKTALFNLIDNAVKYGGTEPISLSLETDDQQIAISVADLGPGIEPGELNLVREKFIRGQRRRRQIRGGLGLYLVDRIIAEFGGRFELRPNTPRGISAVIILPRCA